MGASQIMDWPTKVQFLAGQSCLCTQLAVGLHPASYPVGTRCPFWGGKNGMMLTTKPRVVLRSRGQRRFSSSRSKILHGMWWDSFTLLGNGCSLLINVSCDVIDDVRILHGVRCLLRQPGFECVFASLEHCVCLLVDTRDEDCQHLATEDIISEGPRKSPVPYVPPLYC
ncbi:uncharacterized protein LOC110831215 isoform X2 [Zootermopsis nevadensis]|uniref:uncharacterized protein LOC110831215 isoform X2 n=1 Tax=Zootermopsis nevadensis TaxID=136037 RepID=UPI000B8E3859|nr:uncharacterized protein LOC110831215 isoform X2 [Zootermopsis nevadensis]